eukprot:6185605-Pleurochrysis_carterae.AAC.4
MSAEIGALRELTDMNATVSGRLSAHQPGADDDRADMAAGVAALQLAAGAAAFFNSLGDS